ncbi:uncharacterized protein AMSG_04824 [Thecamonas trahens ATCC 50062]|uniref:Uncharacterized protein n=1 Tax=Thecamonas trahens ATCC 50062 TaxID=461836 RepID=A0A0L0D8G3_THETB|nr:hypothetical protein AMSG_04824 [Thecamonas trahens ATCC 50062]KNC48376.1 hypothetical protein AMSG_04824 [Thecamonas trahens ATCC 50062]|eukprot:XP_013758494.1 hypothetical protein AMSG_04824 [Thecamonas trahens ATCC 50062]
METGGEIDMPSNEDVVADNPAFANTGAFDDFLMASDMNSSAGIFDRPYTPRKTTLDESSTTAGGGEGGVGSGSSDGSST